MNFISVENISKNYNEKWLFKNLNFGLSQGDKVAIVGHNGAGKSTFIKILSGLVQPDEGTVVVRKDIKIGLLEQDPKFHGNQKVLETLFNDDNPTLAVVKEYENALAHPENAGLQEAMEKMDSYNAWDYEQRAKQIITKMGLPDLEQSVSTLSGGQNKRLALAKLLIEEPDLIIMDEPTNHLDLDTVEWLEGHLSSRNVTLLIVTHDRYFLDKVAKQVVELDGGKLYTYKGNYSYYVEKKAERELQEQTELHKAKQLLKKELEWMRRQPKARGTKSKSRIDAFYDLEDKTKDKKSNQKLELDIKTTRQGNKVIEIHDISKGFGDNALIDHFSYNFKKQDRIGIIGKNGAGKSTFLNMISGLTTPDKGEIVKGETTVIGYFSQKTLELPEDKRIIDVVKEIAEVITLGNGEQLTVSKFLEHFLFPPAMQYTYVSKLSGGEKKRLQLLLILVKNPNFLILDEPTNDLDIDTLNVLEDFLVEFNGSLMIVSHDRYFMDKLTDHLFVFEGEGKIKDFPGNYTDYRVWAEEEEELQKMLEKEKDKPKQAVPSQTKSEVNSGEKKKLSFAERREFETLEKELEALDKRKTELITLINSGNSNYDELSKWSKELETLTETIDEKTFRWMELSENS